VGNSLFLAFYAVEAGVALLMFTVGLSQLLLGCAQQRTDWGALAKGVATVQDRHR
jgi:hypothetical protein